jgi:two-component system sensor histidine kinase RegB
MVSRGACDPMSQRNQARAGAWHNRAVPPQLLPWLHRVRGLTALGQGVLLAVAFGTGERPIAGLWLLAALGVVEGVRIALRLVAAPLAHVIVDVLTIGAFVFAWAEPHQPLEVFWLVLVALVATFEPAPRAWGVTAFAILVAVASLVLPGLVGFSAHGESTVHLVAHAATFGLGAVAITGFLSAIADASRRQSLALTDAEEQRDRAARLAAVGTLAAGVAHELATPLGSIGLLAEEIAHDPSALPGLQAQLARCRTILDRMLARGAGSDGRTAPVDGLVASWVEQWRHGNPGTPLVCETQPVPAVRGGADGWRAALWTVLDNAKRAGPPIHVQLAPGAAGAVLLVDDHGPGVSAEVARRVGEPFLTRWRGGGGAGLGLYVARTFAVDAGGELTLEPRTEGGTRARLVMAAEASKELP